MTGGTIEYAIISSGWLAGSTAIVCSTEKEARRQWRRAVKTNGKKSRRKKGYFFIRLLAMSPPRPNNVPITIMLGSGTGLTLKYWVSE